MIGIALLQVALLGFTPCDTGRDPGQWESQGVIYARVKDLVALERKEWWGPTHRILFEVEASLTGAIDPACVPEVVATGRIGFGINPLTKPPQVNSHVAAVIGITPDGKYQFIDGSATYMPGQLPILTVENFADPKIDQLRRALAEIRTAPPTPKKGAAARSGP